MRTKKKRHAAELFNLLAPTQEEEVVECFGGEEGSRGVSGDSVLAAARAPSGGGGVFRCA